jgi:hypothetical protein
MANKRATKKAPLKSSKASKASRLPKAAKPARGKPTKATRGDVVVTRSAADTPVARTVKGLLAAIEPLTSEKRAAFRKLATDAQRGQRGTRTHADDVVKAGGAVAVDVANQTAKIPAIGDDYTSARFAYFLESILALDAAILVQREEDAEQGAARAGASTGRDSALAVRRRVEKRLLRFAGRRMDLREAVKKASGRATTAADLQRSLGALAALAAGYLAEKDEQSRFLLRESGVTSALVDEARAASESATDAAVDAAGTGDARPADAPLVNIAEGTVLLELEHALEVFDELADTVPGVKRLVIHSTPVRHAVERGGNVVAATPDPPPAPPLPVPVPAPPPPPPEQPDDTDAEAPPKG